jgi:hypothetical protein
MQLRRLARPEAIQIAAIFLAFPSDRRIRRRSPGSSVSRSRGGSATTRLWPRRPGRLWFGIRGTWVRVATAGTVKRISLVVPVPVDDSKRRPAAPVFDRRCTRRRWFRLPKRADCEPVRLRPGRRAGRVAHPQRGASTALPGNGPIARKPRNPARGPSGRPRN